MPFYWLKNCGVWFFCHSMCSYMRIDGLGHVVAVSIDCIAKRQSLFYCLFPLTRFILPLGIYDLLFLSSVSCLQDVCFCWIFKRKTLGSWDAMSIYTDGSWIVWEGFSEPSLFLFLNSPFVMQIHKWMLRSKFGDQVWDSWWILKLERVSRRSAFLRLQFSFCCDFTLFSYWHLCLLEVNEKWEE